MKILIVFMHILMASTVFAMPGTIVIMRHAEKPAQGNELSERGWLRAQALPELFEMQNELIQADPPVALYGMAPKNTEGSVRAIQTLKYVSEKYNIAINSEFTKKQTLGLINDIKSNKKYDGKLVVICWEHDFIIEIAQLLGAKTDLKWPDQQFDRYWKLEFSPAGDLVKFDDLPERLLPGDSKN